VAHTAQPQHLFHQHVLYQHKCAYLQHSHVSRSGRRRPHGSGRHSQHSRIAVLCLNTYYTVRTVIVNEQSDLLRLLHDCDRWLCVLCKSKPVIQRLRFHKQQEEASSRQRYHSDYRFRNITRPRPRQHCHRHNRRLQPSRYVRLLRSRLRLNLLCGLRRHSASLGRNYWSQEILHPPRRHDTAEWTELVYLRCAS
jgi:hypothetical protein